MPNLPILECPNPERETRESSRIFWRSAFYVLSSLPSFLWQFDVIEGRAWIELELSISELLLFFMKMERQKNSTKMKVAFE